MMMPDCHFLHLSKRVCSCRTYSSCTLTLKNQKNHHHRHSGGVPVQVQVPRATTTTPPRRTERMVTKNNKVFLVPMTEPVAEQTCFGMMTWTAKTATTRTRHIRSRKTYTSTGLDRPSNCIIRHDVVALFLFALMIQVRECIGFPHLQHRHHHFSRHPHSAVAVPMMVGLPVHHHVHDGSIRPRFGRSMPIRNNRLVVGVHLDMSSHSSTFPPTHSEFNFHRNDDDQHDKDTSKDNDNDNIDMYRPLFTKRAQRTPSSDDDSALTSSSSTSLSKTLRQMIRTCMTTISSINKGTKIHMIYTMIMLLIPILFWNVKGWKGSCSALSRYAMTFSFMGMAYDNMINGLGRYIGPTHPLLLRQFTKGRYLFHSVVMPIIFIPILECYIFSHGGIGGGMNGWGTTRSNSISTTCFLLAIVLAVGESIHWIKYDPKRFTLIDQRNNTNHITHHLAGTFKYTCPDVLQCVLPAVITTLLQIILGMILIIHNNNVHHYNFFFSTGKLVLAAGLTALWSATGCTRRPDIQLLLEPASLVMIWIAASNLY